MNNKLMVSKLKKKFITSLLEKNKRVDRVGLLEYKKIEYSVGIISTSDGSSKVKFGNNEVLVGIKLSPGIPYPDSPNRGSLIVSFEMSPISNEDVELGPFNDSVVELSRVVDRGIRESGIINFEKMAIKEGELVWNCFIDIYPINWSGSLFDVSLFAAVCALKNTKIPYKKYKVEEEKNVLLTDKIPISTTFYKIGNNFILDPNLDEENISTARITIVTVDNNYCAIQKGGMGTITVEELKKYLDIAIIKGEELRKYLL